MARVRLNDIKSKLNTNVNDLFSTEDIRQGNSSTERIKNIALADLHEFKNHPFYVLEDEKMEETKASISEHGVLIPIIVRESEDGGGYEIISGHRRTYACKLLGMEKIPAIIRNLTNEESIIAMVDSNIQRETLLFSEKAFAYRMKFDAIKKQGKRNDLSDTNTNERKSSADLIGESSGESGRQIKRFIRLTYLVKPLLDLVDNKSIPLNGGVELSYIKEESEQLMLAKKIDEFGVFPSIAQCNALRECSSNDGGLTEEKIDYIFNKKTVKTKSITLKHSKLKNYFPDNYTVDDMEKTIISLLEEWGNKKGD